MASDSPIPWISAEEIFARVGFGAAVHALQAAVRDGLDPASDFSRSILGLANGQLLLMPTQSAEFVGVKVATVAPGNPALGQERIQGVYLLMDAANLSPVALLDGIALTTLRTPAVSAAAADLLAPDEAPHLVVFGSGPQAWGHIEAMRAIRRLERVTVIGRHPGRAQALADRVQASGLAARTGTADAVQDAQLIVCATTARTPLFDGDLVPVDSCTVAVGSHEPNARELPSALIGRAQVVVEDSQVALREGGDVLIPIRDGVIDAESLVPLCAILTGEVTVDRSRPRVFTSSGMSWEDLVVAAAVFRQAPPSARAGESSL
ncbi:ornithine cyclodeaminase family protein [Cryobacterium sp. TMT1-21]|uniref:Ornithine cyclodeaminase family protein n=1 Tax=Cryobacterium shii TaxID=1259235 RepID=A0AAQ2C6R8_9MICO|nr:MULTISPECIES: ornithine cyclodeaminase family protein [Cryobacterium]TFC48617.1 ornithine cyclodeaminase family protein [Cryobacterium shii]TFC86634.1 ornithine cyclodeaminase family protein [Cryobacterium sp. TmT2-59]TFD07887.1 ornithine cyclodeaminase family protein [Cryobacterium sp. TMT1-21]TFD15616.1 ornithine cyclodeaminase family protein [Cryobacterium sp. TMT4-10]TFD26961.1 ornithine cyclodeaminase family protein [Cryobacterium sp. TMT2-23]